MGISHVNDRDWPVGDCPVRSRDAWIADGRSESATDQLTPFRGRYSYVRICENLSFAFASTTGCSRRQSRRSRVEITLLKAAYVQIAWMHDELKAFRRSLGSPEIAGPTYSAARPAFSTWVSTGLSRSFRSE